MSEPLFDLAAGLARSEAMRAQIQAFGRQLAAQQATDVERCAFCGHECLTTEHLPYCSAICAIDAEQS